MKKEADIPSTTTKAPALTLPIPSKREIHLGAYYNPRLLPDYGGELFRHHDAKLMQHDVRGMDNKIIPPWEYYEELRPGTIVLCNVTMHMYQINNPKQKKIRKVKCRPTETSLPLTNNLTQTTGVQT